MCYYYAVSNLAFDSTFFSGNRARLKQLFTGTAPIVITAAGQMQRSTDDSFPFHQDRSFWYLTGIDIPDVILVMDKGKEYLIVPEREAAREAFDGAIDTQLLSRISGIQEVYTEKEGWRQLGSRVRKVQHIATLGAPPVYHEFWGIYANPARAALIRRLKELNDGLELLDLRQHLARMRMRKQPDEIAAIQQAIDVTIDAIKDVTRPKKLAKYAYEYEVEADLTRNFRRAGAEGHAFSPIVASGERTCTMHHFINNAALAQGELLLLDIGSAWNHYSSDIARTVVLGGQPTRRQEQVYQAVLDAQDYAFSLIRPGVLPLEYEKQMESYIGEKLRELGLIKSINRDTVRKFFPHMTSHYMGLDDHDVGDYETPWEPGVVLAVEPGIYIPEESLGVRIEDDVLVTEEGCQILSARLPRSLC
jgi:Xaa-Pro aminopeptidase